MSARFLVACDGSPASGRALKLAITQAKLTGASLVLAHVLEWSPYSFLTPEELEQRHRRREEELGRAREALVNPLLEAVAEEAIQAEAVIRYGHVAETLTGIAEEQAVSQIFIGRTGHSRLSTRVFGSVAATIAQLAPVPFTIVP
jgi:nucleotide-binding universal stress UspA family protein